MHANDTNMKGEQNNNDKIIYRELSYCINGFCFKVHNTLGRYCKEKQYSDALECIFRENKVAFEREKALPVAIIDNNFTNKADFVIDDKIVIEVKARHIVTKDDYYQIQRYLKAGGYRLGMIINFRNKYLKPIRVIRVNS